MTTHSLNYFAARVYEALTPRGVRVGLHNRWYLHCAAEWQKIKNTPRAVIHRIEPDWRMKLYGDSQLCEMIHVGGFELETRDFFRAFFREGDLFLDAGANVGLFTLGAANCVGKSGYVHAFEPCAHTFSRLVENVRLNGLKNVSCHCLALSDKNGEADMFANTDGLDAYNSLGRNYGGNARHEKVRTLTIDAFVKEHRLIGKIAAMKIDVEGWETKVLAGATELLSREDGPVLCVEFTEEAAQGANSSCAALYRMLERFGYNMFTVSDRPEAVIPFPLCDPFPNLNLLAVKRIEDLKKRLSTTTKR
jgi:FkbM family methyltransferase